MSYTEIANYLAHRRGLEKAENFSNAVELLFTALEEGNTVIESPLQEIEILKEKSLISDDQSLNAPLVSRGQYLWLNRIFQWEKSLTQDILARIHHAPLSIPPLDQKAHEALSDAKEQKEAVLLALRQNLTIINGGPGTGKTYTVSHIVRAIIEHQPNTRIAFAAPTGKAAKRMEESLKRNALLQPYLAQLPEAQTIHRLLGLSRGREPLYHHQQPLPVDLLIIDEASMLSLELATALFSACPINARLILLGDADQLAAVDAGAVLHDLSTHPALQSSIATLTKARRFNSESGIGQLALKFQKKEVQQIRPHLENKEDITWHSSIQKSGIYQQLFKPYLGFIETLKNPVLNPRQCFQAFDEYRILCAGHLGELGCEKINEELKKLHLQALQQPMTPYAYHGMPILITANNYDLGLFNGDIGLCLLQDERMMVVFPETEQSIPISAISPFQRTLAYALTVHKSQGSEYPHVALLMDESSERLLTRELLYTGLTRAKENIDIYAHEQVLQKAVDCSTIRQTGLSELLEKG